MTHHGSGHRRQCMDTWGDNKSEVAYPRHFALLVKVNLGYFNQVESKVISIPA